ncbi:MAG TPA: CapA family protein [Jatrophihabitantaceae bacterium]|nr:CapA family protein [Jatrophihabitantaceae bacterium]
MRSPQSRTRRDLAAALATVAVLASSCTAAHTNASPRSAGTNTLRPPTATRSTTSGDTGHVTSAARPAGEFTMSFAGDVHFSGRVRARLDSDPATVFAEAAAGLATADITMVNLETAITTGGEQQNKAFTFRAPPSAFTALRDAGIDVATMANNHGADYGTAGLHDTLAAIEAAHFPVVGIGADAAHAYAPWTTTVNGTKVAIIAADQVQDETTLRLFSAGPHSPGVANAFSDRLITSVRAAKAAGYVVIVYVHWGIEYTTCPSSAQTQLASALAHAGAAAVIGTHAHVLQGAGWRADGTYVEYGLGNYLWWMSFGNNQDDNGVLTLTFRDGRVVADRFAPSHLDSRGVPLPATGEQAARITAEWNADRSCAGLSARPPA